MAAEIRMRNGNGRSEDVTCSSVAAVETLVHSKPMVAFSRKSATATLQWARSADETVSKLFHNCLMNVPLHVSLQT
jgi:hypothetical protein